MTTISASVFSGLTGADPLLISRAVALLNDQRLTTLEPLRQALNEGRWIIRSSTPDDNMVGDSAKFIDPTGTQQGQIVLNVSDLTRSSELSVLQFIDNLVHESEHGAQSRIEAREDAVDYLMDPANGSATARGDAYIAVLLDDESSARYAAWQFRLELAGLNTPYARFNQITLATDVLYKEFGRLQSTSTLTGAELEGFIVLGARKEMASYADYAATNANYVVNALQLTGTPAVDFLNHVKTSFNVVAYEVIDPILHDDGSASASVIYANGARKDLVFDSDGHLTRTTAKDAQGRIDWVEDVQADASVYRTDYDQDNSKWWNREESSLDASGNTLYSILYDDYGSVSRTDFDVSDTQAWSNVVTGWDAQGILSYKIVVDDDGSQYRRDFDTTGWNAWNSIDTQRDSLFQALYQTYYYDDGSAERWSWDPANEYSWYQVSTRWDTLGRMESQGVLTDDGISINTLFDTFNQQTWSIKSSGWDYWGRQDFQLLVQDDGSTDRIDFDEASAHAWDNIQERWDSLGRYDYWVARNDDGSVDQVDYDQANTYGWQRLEERWDSLLRRDYLRVHQEDGNVEWYDFDQANEREDSVWSNAVDTLGREIWRDVTFDDGTRTRLEFDPSNSSSASSVERRFDAQGREDSRNTVFDDGTREAIDFDQDGTHAWNYVHVTYAANGREQVTTRAFDDGSSFLVFHDYYGFNSDRLVGLNVVGQMTYEGQLLSSGIVVNAEGSTWNSAYGEGLGVEYVFGGRPPPVYSPFPPQFPDLYPNPGRELDAYVEVGPLEPVSW